jgi:hypothetical protein
MEAEKTYPWRERHGAQCWASRFGYQDSKAKDQNYFDQRARLITLRIKKGNTLSMPTNLFFGQFRLSMRPSTHFCFTPLMWKGGKAQYS